LEDVTTDAQPTDTAELARELAELRRANDSREARSAKTRRTVLLVVVLALAALVGLWSTGRMDPFLSQFGMNKNDCIKNGFGATFCGDDAKQYEQNVSNALAGGSDGGSGDSTAGLQSDLREAIPTLEAYYSDTGTYVGATHAKLRQIDTGLPTDIRVVSARANAYCLEASNGVATVSVTGPGATWSAGPCP
jgi:hypothetical protein